MRRWWKLLVITTLVAALASAWVAWRRWSTRKGAIAVALSGPVPSAGPDLSAALYQTTGARLSAGHQVDVLDNGAVFDALIDEIGRARASVHVVMYIWEAGKASDRVVDAIRARVKRGVSCRILVDAFGSMGFESGVGATLRTAGCEVRIFRPIPGSDELARNHRKIVIVDGQVAFTGGFGVRDDWLGHGRRDDQWRDTQVRFRGPAVDSAQQAFAENWQEAGGTLLPASAFAAESARGPARAAFVASTASPTVTRAERLTLLMIGAATRRIWIANAYFVPSASIVELLKSKAKQGVDVRILIPGRKSDSKTSFGLQKTQSGSLIDHGLKLWEYAPTMMHSKTMVIDDTLSLIGTINLEPLSLSKLDEAALVVEDRAINKTLARHFESDCRHAVPLHAVAE
jgi:cardiolipin synthase A/B